MMAGRRVFLKGALGIAAGVITGQLVEQEVGAVTPADPLPHPMLAQAAVVPMKLTWQPMFDGPIQTQVINVGNVAQAEAVSAAIDAEFPWPDSVVATKADPKLVGRWIDYPIPGTDMKAHSWVIYRENLDGTVELLDYRTPDELLPPAQVNEVRDIPGVGLRMWNGTAWGHRHERDDFLGSRISSDTPIEAEEHTIGAITTGYYTFTQNGVPRARSVYRLGNAVSSEEGDPTPIIDALPEEEHDV